MSGIQRDPVGSRRATEPADAPARDESERERATVYDLKVI